MIFAEWGDGIDEKGIDEKGYLSHLKNHCGHSLPLGDNTSRYKNKANRSELALLFNQIL